jgi:hypothetical protein
VHYDSAERGLIYLQRFTVNQSVPADSNCAPTTLHRTFRPVIWTDIRA